MSNLRDSSVLPKINTKSSVLPKKNTKFDREEERARMLSENLTDEAKMHLEMGFKRFREDPDKYIETAEDITGISGEQLVKDFHQHSINQNLVKKETNDSSLSM